MDLFDLLILMVFVGIPLLEGLMRRGRKDRDLPAEGGLPTEDVGSETDVLVDDEEEVPARFRGEPETSSSAEMVPDDLWELLTGERRSSTARTEPSGRDGAEGDWSPEPVAVQDGVGTMRDSDWISAPAALPTEDEDPVSLDRYTPEVVSLEQPLQDPEERHQAFHDRMDSLIEATSIGSGGGTADRAAPLRAALSDPSDLRQAVLLSEVLGPPVGLRAPGEEGGGGGSAAG